MSEGETNGITNGAAHEPACTCDGAGFMRVDVVPKGGGHPVATYEVCPAAAECERASGEGVPVVDLDFEGGDTEQCVDEIGGVPVRWTDRGWAEEPEPKRETIWSKLARMVRR